MLLSKDQIIEAKDLPHRDVDVADWGGTVRVITMSAGERDSYEMSIYDMDGTDIKVKRDDFRAKLLARCLVDENNERIFTDSEVKVLSKKGARPVQELFEVAQELNGIGTLAEEDIKKK